MVNGTLLALLILGPLLICTLTLVLFYKDKNSWPISFKYALSLHPDLGLAKQGLFWWSLCTPTAYFLTFGAVCWSDYTISITPEGFKTFISISALPLALLSIAVPLGVTVARFHSTEQTARQILLAKQKNNLDAFYSHRKEFFAFFDKIGTTTFLDALDVEYKINPRLHGIFYEGTPDEGTPVLNEKLVDKLTKKIDQARSHLNFVLLNTDPTQTLNHYMLAASEIYSISMALGAREVKDKLYSRSRTLVSIDSEGKEQKQRTLGHSTSEAIAAYRCVKSYLLTILYFSGEHRLANKIHDNEIEYIDTTGGYLTINNQGLTIEWNFNPTFGTGWRFTHQS